MSSSPYTVTAAQAVSGVSVDITPPTSAAGGLTTYVVSFTTSSTGALDGTGGSAVTIALPANTGLDSFDNGGYSSLRPGAADRLLRRHRHQRQHAHRGLLPLQRGHGRRLDPGHRHPDRGDQSSGGTPTLAVSTSSDTTPVTSPGYTVTPPQPVSGVTVGVSSPTSAAGGLTTYVVSFTTSSTGALDGTTGSTVTIALPANTGLDSFNNGGYSSLSSGGSPIGYCDATDTTVSTPTVTCSLSSGDTVGASTPVTATLTGVTNPPAGTPTLAVSTTSDVTPVTSPAYT